MATGSHWLLFFLLLVGIQTLCFASCCDQKGCLASVTNSNSKKISTSTKCPKGESLYGAYCLKTCPSGYYTSKGKCTACHRVCATCVNANCSSCHNDTILTLQGSCSKKCSAQSGGLVKTSSSQRIRLVHGRSSLEGRIEVYYNGSWGTLCAEGWDMNAATVVCRELNLGSVIEPLIVDQGQRFPQIDGYKNTKIWLNGIHCKGNEKSILECDHEAWGNNECSHLEDVGVRCKGPDTSKRCVKTCGDGYYFSKGRCLECPLDCKICNGSDSCLKCVDWRYLEGKQCVSRCKPHTYGKSLSWKCETCPSHCSTCSEINSHVVCTSCQTGLFLDGGKCVDDCKKLVAFSNYLRLSGNFTTPYEGLLEVRYKGGWHTVCDDLFGLEDARVMCRELGMGQPESFSGGEHGSGTGQILTRNLICFGNEKSFVDCNQRTWFSFGCTHREDVGLVCSPPAQGFVATERCVPECRRGLFRSSHNTCELCSRKCITCAGSPESCTSCREPFFINGTSCLMDCPNGHYVNVSSRTCPPCKAGCLTCKDRPDNCLSCIPSLLHTGTRCVSSCPADTYRHGHTCVSKCGFRFYGRGKQCHSCTQLNCLVCELDGSKDVCKACSIGYVLNSQGACVQNCTSGYVAAPLNKSTLGISPVLRLRNTGSPKFSGRLEVLHDGIWGSICDDMWFYNNTMIACAQLMLGPPKRTVYLRPKSYLEMNISRIWLDDVRCKGNEESILQCTHRGWGVENCVHNEDVHIECQSPGVSECAKKCPSGYYASGTFCKPCDDKCLACYGLASNCSKCMLGFHHAKTATCLDRCLIGHYATADKQCLDCDASCWTCEGSKENCTSCKSPSFLSGNKCVTSCPVNTYPQVNNSEIQLLKTRSTDRLYGGLLKVNVDGKTGFACGWRLSIGTANVICRQLNMGKALSIGARRMYWFRTRPILIKNPRCVGNESSLFECAVSESLYYWHCNYRNLISVQCSGPDTTRRCLDNCPTSDGYYVTSDGLCERCYSNCLQCDKNNASLCTACKKDLYLSLENKCIPYCPEGTYYDSSTKKCQQCSAQCLACNGSKERCTDCRGNKTYLSGTNCVSKCLKSYGKIGVAGIRLAGGMNTSSGRVEIHQNNGWMAVCGAFWDIKNAAVVCRQLGYGDPIRMYTRFSFLISVPIAQKSFHCTGLEQDFFKCRIDDRCRGRSNAFVECSRSTPRRTCVSSCGTGYYTAFNAAKLQECRPCSSTCYDCSGTADHCIACNMSSFLEKIRCVTSCPEGFYGNLKSRKCEACDPKCTSCLSGWTNNRCLSCNHPYFLNNTKCVDDCYPDYTLPDLLPSDGPNHKVRLRDVTQEYEGRPEVFRDGRWGQVCYLSGFSVNLICQELGYQSGHNTVRIYNPRIFVGQIWGVSCSGYENVLDDCRFTKRSLCIGISPRNIQCSKKLLDKRVCRKIKPVPCRRDTCFAGTRCVDGDGSTIPKGSSFCMHCPSISRNYFGDGDNCTEISNTPPTTGISSRNFEKHFGSWFRLFCNGRSGLRRLSPGRYSWKKDGKLLPATTTYITYRNIHYTDAGLYTCTLRNSLGSVTINFNVTVVGFPLITRADNVDAVEGTNVILTCYVLSNPPANITWYFNDYGRHGGPKPLPNGSLEITESRDGDSGNYTCEAKNKFGAVNETVTLRLTEEPSFKKGANDLVIARGDTATFSCLPLSTGQPMKIIWRRNGTRLKTSERIIVNNTNELVIKDVSQADCGQYYCVARSDESIITSVGTLAIDDAPPCIHTPPQDLSLQVGMYARFYCDAAGRHVTIDWEGKGKGHSKVFEIKSVKISDVGVYICSVKSGKKQSRAYAFLSVDGKYACPYIFLKPKNIGVNSGGQAVFHCDGVAIPSYNITWYRGNVEIADNKRISVTDKNRKLVISSVGKGDVGQYSCVVRSPFGRQSASASLRLLDTNFSAVSQSSSSNVAGIVIGVLITLLFVLVVIYFVRRYRRDGANPVDVFHEMKRKTAYRFRREKPHTILRYDTEHVSQMDDDVYDTSDTNPFVRG